MDEVGISIQSFAEVEKHLNEARSAARSMNLANVNGLKCDNIYAW